MFISPEQIIDNLNLKQGDTVADFGCGAGAYVFAASEKVGDTGKVLAVDLDEAILEKIKRESEKKGNVNIKTILANVENVVPIENFSCDVIILSNLLSLVKNIDNILNQVKKYLKPEGYILVVDWKNSDSPLVKLRPAILDEEKAVAILAKNDFSVKKHFPAGEYHYAFTASL